MYTHYFYYNRIRFNGNIVPDVVIKEIKYEDGQEELVVIVLIEESAYTLGNVNKMSLHRLHFPHPNTILSDIHSKRNTSQTKSIFFNVDNNEYAHFIIEDITNGRESPVSVCGVNDNIVAIGTKHGSIIIVEMLGRNDHQEYVLKESGPILDKVFNLFQQKEHNSLIGLVSEKVLLYIDGRVVSDYYIFAINKDKKLRVWSSLRKVLLMVIPLEIEDELQRGPIEQVKFIRIMWNDKYKFTLAVVVQCDGKTYCQVFKGKIEGSGEVELQLKVITNYPEASVIDTQISLSENKVYLWGLLKKKNKEYSLLSTLLTLKRKNVLEMNLWQESMLNPEDFEEQIINPNETAPQNDVIGIYCPENSGCLVFLVRKQNISVMREGSISEFFSYTIDRISNDQKLFIQQMDSNVYSVLSLMASIEKELGYDFMESFDSRMYSLEDPFSNAVQTIESYLGKKDKYPIYEERNIIHAEHFTYKIIPLFKRISNLPSTLEYILNQIEYIRTINQELEDIEPATSSFMEQDNIFASDIIDDIVFQSIRNILKSNYQILRNILIIATLSKHYRYALDLSKQDNLKISKIINRISIPIKNYCALMWFSSQPLSKNSLMDFQFNSIAPIVSRCDYAVQFYYAIIKDKLIDLFMKVYIVKSYLSHITFNNDWNFFLPYVLSVIEVIHPNVILEEFSQYDMPHLLIHEYNQSTFVQNYIRLIDEPTPYFQYLLGTCYLVSSEYQKAMDCFIKGAAVVESVRDARLDYLIEQFLDDQSKLEWESWVINYWKFVIDLLQRFNCYDVIVKLSFVALKSAKTIETQDLFWSNIFHNSLAIGNYNTTYLALISNPIEERRHDCLNTFISKMAESNKSKQLVQFPFSGFQDLVDQFLMDKAKKSKLNEFPNYFEILYAYNIKRKNYGRAAMAMYECAIKEMSESHFSIDSLRQRCRLLLATINALKMVDPQNAWLVVRTEQTQRSLHKRRFDEELPNQLIETDQEKCIVEIKHLKDIENLYKKFNNEYKAMLKMHMKS